MGGKRGQGENLTKQNKKHTEAWGIKENTEDKQSIPFTLEQL